jgi:hypothetical protein
MKELITEPDIAKNNILKERKFDMSEETDINMYKQEGNAILVDLSVPAIPLTE